MTKIICQMTDCINWEDGLCNAEQIKVSAEGYCLTYEEVSDAKAERDDWADEDEDKDLDEWEDEDDWEEEEEDDDWGDDDDDF